MPRGRKAAAKKSAPRKAPAKKGASTEFHEQIPDAKEEQLVTPAMIADACREVMEQRSEIAGHMAVLNSIYNRWMAQGIDKKAIKATVADMLAQKTVEQVAEETRLRVEYGVAAGTIRLADAEWTKSVWQAHFQLMPAAGEVSDNLRGTRAKIQGISAGRKGHAIDSNPYRAIPGSPEFVGWRNGLEEGLVYRKMLKPDERQTNVVAITTGKRGRGRPRKVHAEEPTPTALEQDEAAYRAKGVGQEVGHPEAAAE
jgi:hypothetical protein